MVNIQSTMNESCLEPSVTSVRFSADRERFGGGRGGLSPNVGLPGPLVSGSPGGTSGPLGGISPASGSNLVVGASGTNQRRFDEDVNLPLIKVVVLGAPAVGKTSVVRRFVANEFSDEHRKTKKKSEHFPSLILNESLFELKLIDLPVIPFFPTDSLSEWTDYRFYGLRSAAAYILVYDVSVPSSFHFVKAIREQMYESRDMTNIPVIVVANKMDLAATTKIQQNGHQLNSHRDASNAIPINSFNSNNHLVDLNGHTNHHNTINSIAERAASSLGATSAGGLLTATSTADVVYYDRKEISHLVRKTWRSAHIECSAKYNWNIMTVFRELAITLDMVANGQGIGSNNSSARKRRCLVF